MNKKKIRAYLAFIYTIVFLVLLLLLAQNIIGKEKHDRHLHPNQLMTEVLGGERFISCDQVADRIIKGDPSFRLIDVRDEESFMNYSLPDAINIPFSSLFDKEYEEYIHQEQYDLVFFSNDHYLADQAWLLCARQGLRHIYVMKGGLNSWFESIINPKAPGETAPVEAFELYSTRKASSMYFGVVYPEPIVSEPNKFVNKSPKKVIPIKKKKKLPIEGGC
jgi:rhodanese-related sulfurtransferase